MNVKQIRESKGMTQQELSDKTGIPRGRINQWEQRNTIPKKEDYDILVSFFKSLETNVSYERRGNNQNYNSNASPVTIVEENEQYYNRFGNVFEPLEDGNYLMQVPIITEYARGGRMAGFSDKEYFDELPKHTVVVDKIHRGKYLSFKVAGERVWILMGAMQYLMGQ